MFWALSQGLCILSITESIRQRLITPILQVKRLRLKETNWLNKVTVSKWLLTSQPLLIYCRLSCKCPICSSCTYPYGQCSLVYWWNEGRMEKMEHDCVFMSVCLWTELWLWNRKREWEEGNMVYVKFFSGWERCRRNVRSIFRNAQPW